MITLPPLPYAREALEPILTAETLDYHYGKHHQGYVTKLNELIEGTELENRSLEEIVQNSTGAVFNNAAQAWNHGFYWESMRPIGGSPPTGRLADSINESFGGFKQFMDAFTKAAVDTFGSGWTWLVQLPEGRLSIVSTSNAETPIAGGDQPLLTCDVWEHAYYIDYRNARPKYVESFWKIVDWERVASRMR